MRGADITEEYLFSTVHLNEFVRRTQVRSA